VNRLFKHMILCSADISLYYWYAELYFL